MSENTAAVATPAAEEPKKEKAPRVTLPKQNGVSRPKSGTQTGRVWEIADELSKVAGKPAARKDVINTGVSEKINPATLATQYGRWRRFHGLKAEPKAPKAEATAAPADVTVQK